jgi:hypothetical protein
MFCMRIIFWQKMTKKLGPGTFEASIALNTLKKFGYHFEVEAIACSCYASACQQVQAFFVKTSTPWILP